MRAQIISFHCVLKNTMGKVISSTFNQDVITHIEDPGDLLKGLAEGLQGLHKGEKRRICLTAGQAYGFYDPDKVIVLSRRELQLKANLRPDGQMLTLLRDGERKEFRVVRTAGESVTLDGNHPLAGQDLVFEIETTEARDATPEEIEEAQAPAVTPHLH